jgi:hypothetical protein
MYAYNDLEKACLNVRRDARGEVREIVGAYRPGQRIKTLCGIFSEEHGSTSLRGARGVVIQLSTEGGMPTLLDQANGFIEWEGAEGDAFLEAGQAYCVNAQFDESGEAVKIVGAFKQ